MAEATTARLKQLYESELKSTLKKDLQISNVHEVPKLVKIVVSVGLGKAKEDKRAFEVAENTLRKITAQQPVATISKKSIASFKLREGMKIGLKVTIRDERMYEFFDRLVNIVLPRVRDFHGLPAKSLDATGNFNIGLRDQSVFPELSYEETALPHGIEITIVTSTHNREHAQAYLSGLGMPFEKETK